jgi:hypothetical protein
VNTPASTSDGQQGDPVAVILARMEVKLDNALTEQARHGTEISAIQTKQQEHGNRLTKIEATWQTERVADRLSVVEKKVWGAAGIAALLGGGGAALIARLVGN